MFCDFILDNYSWIISIILAIATLIIHLLKKKPVFNKIDEVKDFILEALPFIINAVEVPGQGSNKKDLVLKEIRLLIAKRFNFFDWESIEEFVSAAIENILSTPKKK